MAYAYLNLLSLQTPMATRLVSNNPFFPGQGSWRLKLTETVMDQCYDREFPTDYFHYTATNHYVDGVESFARELSRKADSDIKSGISPLITSRIEQDLAGLRQLIKDSMLVSAALPEGTFHIRERDKPEFTQREQEIRQSFDKLRNFLSPRVGLALLAISSPNPEEVYFNLSRGDMQLALGLATLTP